MKKIITYTVFVFSIYLQPSNVQAQQDRTSDAFPCVSAYVIVLVDKSFSVKNDQATQCSLLNDFYYSLPISQNKVWIGFGTFGSQFTMQPITCARGKVADQINYVCADSANQDTTILSYQLITLEHYYQQAENARHTFAPKVLVIISDGQFANPDSAQFYCNFLKEKEGVTIFTIAVGDKELNTDVIKKLASSPACYAHEDTADIIERIKALNMCP